MAFYAGVDYAFTDRLSFSVGLPYVFAKYTDPNPPPPPIPYLPVDECHCWNTRLAASDSPHGTTWLGRPLR